MTTQTTDSFIQPPSRPHSMTHPQNNRHSTLTMDIVCVNSTPSSRCCSQQLSCSLRLLLAVGLHLAGLPCDHPAQQQSANYTHITARNTPHYNYSCRPTDSLCLSHAINKSQNHKNATYHIKSHILVHIQIPVWEQFSKFKDEFCRF